ncbi:MAG: hypothetical protein ACYTF0_01600, partial [Planctomycetota bacterium]
MSDATLTVSIDELAVDITPYLTGPRQSVDHHLHTSIAKHLNIGREQVLDYTIERRSLDARQRPALKFLYRLNVTVPDGCPVREGAGVEVHSVAPDYDDALYHLPLADDVPMHPLIV